VANTAFIELNQSQWREVHNALCAVEHQTQGIFDVLKHGSELRDAVQALREALKPAYEQESREFDSKMDYYHRFQRENGLQAIWSIYELPVHGFLDRHPFLCDSFVVYRDHWGTVRDRRYPVMGTTWADLYRAADLAIRDSGDDHHVFIEQFHPRADNTVELVTGS